MYDKPLPKQAGTVVPSFNYNQPGIAVDSGSEWYVVRIYNHLGTEITTQFDEFSKLERAVEVAQGLYPNHPVVVITVHGGNYPDGSLVESGIVWDGRLYAGLDDPFGKEAKAEQERQDAKADLILCYPPHIYDDWRLCDQATNNWMGTVENMTGDEIMDLTEWAGRDFQAALKFAQDTVRTYNKEVHGTELEDY